MRAGGVARGVLAGICVLLAAALVAAEPAGTPATMNPGPGGWRYEEIRRFPVPEAGQGVVVAGEFFYAINNLTVAKYRKTTGERVVGWEGIKGGPIIHLNAGVAHAGRLYCAHSNFPGVPMQSSVEIFDLLTAQPVASHALGHTDGSLTWIDRREGKWIACFVHYGRRGGEPGKGPDRSYIAEYDESWRRLREWALPRELLITVGARGYSLSGGALGPGGFLFATGHDELELYVLEFPRSGTALRWRATIPISAEGQAFGWDSSEPGMLYTIGRKKREVIVGRVTAP